MDIKKNYIYRYREKSGTPLCIYLCDTQTQDRILIIPLTENNTGNVFKLSVTKQYADLDSFKEIHKSNIVSALYLDSKPVRIPTTDAEVIQKYIIQKIMSDISADAQGNNTSLTLFESIYQFVRWKGQKLRMNTQPYVKKTNVYENALYWAALGVNVGSELNKNRPVLIWKKRCNGDDESTYSYIAIPITSKQKNKHYYMNVPIDINGRTCYLRIEDMRRINIRRISRPILDDCKKFIFIDEDKRREINEAIGKFYIFENRHKKS